jgi:hypothetical protein
MLTAEMRSVPDRSENSRLVAALSVQASNADICRVAARWFFRIVQLRFLIVLRDYFS